MAITQGVESPVVVRDLAFFDTDGVGRATATEAAGLFTIGSISEVTVTIVGGTQEARDSVTSTPRAMSSQGGPLRLMSVSFQSTLPSSELVGLRAVIERRTELSQNNNFNVGADLAVPTRSAANKQVRILQEAWVEIQRSIRIAPGHPVDDLEVEPEEGKFLGFLRKANGDLGLAAADPAIDSETILAIARQHQLDENLSQLDVDVVNEDDIPALTPVTVFRRASEDGEGTELVAKALDGSPVGLPREAVQSEESVPVIRPLNRYTANGTGTFLEAGDPVRSVKQQVLPNGRKLVTYFALPSTRTTSNTRASDVFKGDAFSGDDRNVVATRSYLRDNFQRSNLSDYSNHFIMELRNANDETLYWQAFNLSHISLPDFVSGAASVSTIVVGDSVAVTAKNSAVDSTTPWCVLYLKSMTDFSGPSRFISPSLAYRPLQPQLIDSNNYVYWVLPNDSFNIIALRIDKSSLNVSGWSSGGWSDYTETQTRSQYAINAEISGYTLNNRSDGSGDPTGWDGNDFYYHDKSTGHIRIINFSGITGTTDSSTEVGAVLRSFPITGSIPSIPNSISRLTVVNGGEIVNSVSMTLTNNIFTLRTVPFTKSGNSYLVGSAVNRTIDPEIPTGSTIIGWNFSVERNSTISPHMSLKMTIQDADENVTHREIRMTLGNSPLASPELYAGILRTPTKLTALPTARIQGFTGLTTGQTYVIGTNGQLAIGNENVVAVAESPESIVLRLRPFNSIQVFDGETPTTQAEITAARVKTLYESNPDTNPFTDAEKTKLAGLSQTAADTTNPLTDAEYSTSTHQITLTYKNGDTEILDLSGLVPVTGVDDLIESVSISGRTLTFTRKDSTTFTLDLPASSNGATQTATQIATLLNNTDNSDAERVDYNNLKNKPTIPEGVGLTDDQEAILGAFEIIGGSGGLEDGTTFSGTLAAGSGWGRPDYYTGDSAISTMLWHLIGQLIGSCDINGGTNNLLAMVTNISYKVRNDLGAGTSYASITTCGHSTSSFGSYRETHRITDVQFTNPLTNRVEYYAYDTTAAADADISDAYVLQSRIVRAEDNLDLTQVPVGKFPASLSTTAPKQSYVAVADSSARFELTQSDIVDGGLVRQVDTDGLFVANYDNSGGLNFSPYLNTKTHIASSTATRVEEGWIVLNGDKAYITKRTITNLSTSTDFTETLNFIDITKEDGGTGGLSSVATDSTIDGTGTSSDPLTVSRIDTSVSRLQQATSWLARVNHGFQDTLVAFLKALVSSIHTSSTITEPFFSSSTTIDITINRSTLAASGFLGSSDLATRYDSSTEEISGNPNNRRWIMGMEFTGQNGTVFGLQDTLGRDVPIFRVSGGILQYNASGSRNNVSWQNFNSVGSTQINIAAGDRLIFQTQIIGGSGLNNEFGGSIRITPVLDRTTQFATNIELNDVEFTNVSGSVEWTTMVLRELTAFKAINYTVGATPKNHAQLNALITDHWDDEYVFGLYRTITVVSNGFSLAAKFDFSSTPSVNGKDLATQEYVDDAVTNSGGGGNPGTSEPTAARVKTLYESNADTNAFTNSEKSKLSAIENNATADQTALEIAALLNDSSNSANQKINYNQLSNRPTIPVPVTGLEIVSRLEALSGASRLDASAIKDIPNDLPAGGTAGQILSKVDGTDYNAGWIDAPGGGGGDTAATRRGTETGFTVGSHVGVSGQAQTSQRLITLPSGKTLADYDRIAVRITWPTSGNLVGGQNINATSVSSFHLPELIAMTTDEWDAVATPATARGASLFHLELNPADIVGTGNSFNLRLRDSNTNAPVQMSTAVIEEVIGVSG